MSYLKYMQCWFQAQRANSSILRLTVWGDTSWLGLWDQAVKASISLRGVNFWTYLHVNIPQHEAGAICGCCVYCGIPGGLCSMHWKASRNSGRAFWWGISSVGAVFEDYALWDYGDGKCVPLYGQISLDVVFEVAWGWMDTCLIQECSRCAGYVEDRCWRRHVCWLEWTTRPIGVWCGLFGHWGDSLCLLCLAFVLKAVFSQIYQVEYWWCAVVNKCSINHSSHVQLNGSMLSSYLSSLKDLSSLQATMLSNAANMFSMVKWKVQQLLVQTVAAVYNLLQFNALCSLSFHGIIRGYVRIDWLWTLQMFPKLLFLHLGIFTAWNPCTITSMLFGSRSPLLNMFCPRYWH